MSTKPCPQCGSAVPLQARFCGQCGRTFSLQAGVPAQPHARIPTTLDEATADPPPVSRPAPDSATTRPHVGMPTAQGHAIVPAPSPGLGPGGSGPASSPQGAFAPPPPAPRPHAGMPTAIGHAAVPQGPAQVAPPQQQQQQQRPHAGAPTTVGHAVAAPSPPAAPPPTFGKTLFDAAPFGAESGHAASSGGAGHTVVSQRPTPLVPPPSTPKPPSAPGDAGSAGPASAVTAQRPEPPKPLAKTMSDPGMADRALKVREAALAEIAAKKDADNALAAAGASPAPPSSRDPSKLEEPVLGKTMVHGGVGGAGLRADRYDEIADLPDPAPDPPTVHTPPLGATAPASPLALHSLGHERPQVPRSDEPPTITKPIAAPTPPAPPPLGATAVLAASPPLESPAPAHAPTGTALGPPMGGPGMSPLSKSVFSPSSAPPPPSSPQAAFKTPMQSAGIKTPVQSAGMQLQPAPIVAASPSAPPAPPPAAPLATPNPLAGTLVLGAAGSDKQTMLGMPATDLAGHAPAPAAPLNPAPAFPAAMKTMMGVAMPGIAPTRDAQQSQPPQQPGAPLGTLLGVAAPGIAPLHPGAQQQQHQQPQQQQHHQHQQPPHHQQQQQQHPSVRSAHGAPSPTPQPAPVVVPAPAPLVMEPLPEAPRAPAKKGVPAIVVVAIVSVLVILIGGGAYVLFLRSGAPLTAQPQLDETGKESLKIRCESCPDGTVISLGASSSKVQGAATLLPLPAPLSIGDNDLEMKIDRPASGRDETVKIHVPVAYRVKADLTTLTSSPPAITVRVEALPGTEVTVDGKPAQLDANGKGAQMIDVTAEVDGPSDDQKAIDKKIPFTIKPKGAAAETGQLVVRAGVVPLHVDAPGRELFTDRATANVSGQTKPGGTLSIDGQSVPLDDKGRFGVRVELPPDGEKVLAITANAPPLAPRTMRAKVTRVATLDAGAKALDAKTPPPIAFDVFSVEPAAKLGQLVVIDGEIVESRVQQGHTVMLIEEKKACAGAAAANGCIVRLVHGEEVAKAARGDTVHAYGRVVGTVTSGGKAVPDIEGTLVVAQPAARKK